MTKNLCKNRVTIGKKTIGAATEHCSRGGSGVAALGVGVKIVTEIPDRPSFVS
jgi:hypothetical protein